MTRLDDNLERVSEHIHVARAACLEKQLQSSLKEHAVRADRVKRVDGHELGMLSCANGAGIAQLNRLMLLKLAFLGGLFTVLAIFIWRHHLGSTHLGINGVHIGRLSDNVCGVLL